MSNLKLLIWFATVRLEIQVGANALQAGTAVVAKLKWVKPGTKGRPGEVAGCLLSVTCSNQREIVFQLLLHTLVRGVRGAIPGVPLSSSWTPVELQNQKPSGALPRSDCPNFHWKFH